MLHLIVTEDSKRQNETTEIQDVQKTLQKRQTESQ
jgi:hypothetical protein